MLIISFISVLWLCEASALYGGHKYGTIETKNNSIKTTGKYGFMVHLKITEIRGKNTRKERMRIGICGGTLIGKDLVLTAAHCLHDFKTPNIKAIVGMTHKAIEPNSPYKLAVDYLKHEKYFGNFFFSYQKNDIALIWLESEFTLTNKVHLAKLPHSRLTLDNQKAFIVGWGQTESGIFPEWLREGELKTISNDLCRKYHKAEKIYSSMFCAISDHKDTIPCIGDSGGPVVVDDVVVGISSWSGTYLTRNGEEKCDPRKPGVFTKISAFSDWIQNNRNEGAPKNRFSTKRCKPKKNNCVVS